MLAFGLFVNSLFQLNDNIMKFRDVVIPNFNRISYTECDNCYSVSYREAGNSDIGVTLWERKQNNESK
jgi:hypothetical protein